MNETLYRVGFADVQKEVDVLVESAMTKLYANEAARLVMRHCCDLHGRLAYLEEEPYHQVRSNVSGVVS